MVRVGTTSLVLVPYISPGVQGTSPKLRECARESAKHMDAAPEAQWRVCMACELRCECFCIDVSMGLRGVMALRRIWVVLMEEMDGLSFDSAVVIDDVKIAWRAQRSGLLHMYVWHGVFSCANTRFRCCNSYLTVTLVLTITCSRGAGLPNCLLSATVLSNWATLCLR